MNIRFRWVLKISCLPTIMNSIREWEFLEPTLFLKMCADSDTEAINITQIEFRHEKDMVASRL